MSEASDAQFGVFPEVPRANDVDQPGWSDKELDRLPYEFVSPDDKSADKEDEKKEGEEKPEGDPKVTTTTTPSAPAAPAPSGPPAAPKG
jgi:hypothetical protein